MNSVINRADARALGEKYYFTGNPCKHGHVAERYVSAGSCVDCVRCASSDFASANPEIVRAKAAAWASANRERKRAQGAARYAKNPERVRAQARAWAVANPERTRARLAAWAKENPERLRSHQAAWRAANPERHRANGAAWAAGNPEKSAAKSAKRRALKRAAIPADWCPSDQAKVRKMYASCKRLEALTGFKWQVDHRVPLSKGGAHCAANLQVIPARLNLRKHAKSLYQEPFAWVADALADPALQLPWLKNA